MECCLRLLASEKVLGRVYETLVPSDPPLPYHVAILVDKTLVFRHPRL